jgi:hypothetical protein
VCPAVSPKWSITRKNYEDKDKDVPPGETTQEKLSVSVRCMSVSPRHFLLLFPPKEKQWDGDNSGCITMVMSCLNWIKV